MGDKFEDRAQAILDEIRRHESAVRMHLEDSEKVALIAAALREAFDDGYDSARGH